jgi:hypothetical protein
VSHRNKCRGSFSAQTAVVGGFLVLAHSGPGPFDAWTRLWDDRGIPLPRHRFPEQLFPDPELYTTPPGKNGWPYSQFMTFNGL